ncbi:MAG: type IV pilus modification protein PilV [Luteimonas sp.]
MNARSCFRIVKRSQAGFSMIEILIALVILALGLLGFALLQTMNLRFAKSANQRTQATNLAYELLDMARANRVLINQYTEITQASFAAARSSNCPLTFNAISTPQDNMDTWRCEVKQALGDNAWAVVTQPGVGVVRVRIRWDDERWVPGNESRQFDVSTQL